MNKLSQFLTQIQGIGAYCRKTSCTRIIPLVSVLFIIMGCKNRPETENNTHPNIIFIISDDQAWTDYGFMGHPDIETPHIDRLSSQGITYTRGYVTAPLCSPSLASIITGLYPHQHGITGNDPVFESGNKRYSREWYMDRMTHFDTLIHKFQNKPKLTDILSEHGYISFQAGKWWLGSYKDGGFDHGMTHGNPEKWGRHGDYGLEIGRQGMDTIYNFIELAGRQDSPFFLWYAPFLPHTPHNPPDSLFQKYLKTTTSEPVARYRANCEWFDVTVGQLLNYLDANGLDKNTMIMYICDNGWVQDPDRPNRYMEGSKRAPYDMGIRTPVMVKWLGHIKPLMDTLTLVSSIDLVPTVLDVLQLKKSEEVEGMSLLHREELRERNQVFSEVFFHDIESMKNPTLSLKYRITIGDEWKLILPSNRTLPDSTAELYNILKDPYEKNNLIGRHPGLTSELKEEFNNWWKPKYE